jgi:hypothetical protein
MKQVPSQRIFDGAHLRADLYGRGEKGLFVTFDNWRIKRAGFPDLGPIQTALDMGFANLMISTAANDWFINAELDDLRQTLASCAAGYPVVRAMGFSMGGFAALNLSAALNIDYAVLFAPQRAVQSETVPFERRWRADAAQITVADDLPRHLNPALRGVLICDPFHSPAERQHLRAIQALAPAMAIAPLPFSGHPPMAVITAGRAYRQVLAATIAGALVANDLRDLHRSHREDCPAYLDKMLAVMRRRGRLDSDMAPG